VRPARAERLRANGLQLVSPHGDVTLAPKLVTAGNIESAYDAVLLTVKAPRLPPLSTTKAASCSSLSCRALPTEK
jgi:ketopantoate reductase